MSLLLNALKKAAEENAETEQDSKPKEVELLDLNIESVTAGLDVNEDELQDVQALAGVETLDFSEELTEIELEADLDAIESDEKIQPVIPNLDSPVESVEVTQADREETSYGSSKHAQQIFASQAKKERSHFFWFFLLLLLFLLGIGLWAYEYFSPPAQVARIGQLKVVAPDSELEKERTEQPVIDKKPTAVLAEKAVTKAKPTPPPARVKKKISIVRNVKRDTLLENLQLGFKEYQQGNYGTSRIAYRRALQQDTKNRDALLGLAANHMRLAQGDEKHLLEAKRLYWDLLELNPEDAAARAGLAAVDKSFFHDNSLASLKEAVQQRPYLAPLHYSLANKYAKQRNWSQAQASYFKALTLAPNNADYTFNLAVSLDKIGQVNTALKYYQRARDLASHSPHAIDLLLLGKRVQYLQGEH